MYEALKCNYFWGELLQFFFRNDKMFLFGFFTYLKESVNKAQQEHKSPCKFMDVADIKLSTTAAVLWGMRTTNILQILGSSGDRKDSTWTQTKKNMSGFMKLNRKQPNYESLVLLTQCEILTPPRSYFATQQTLINYWNDFAFPAILESVMRFE